jgi:hypothetical protein
MAIFYSRKSFNPKVLFADMLTAWGITKLSLAEKVGYYMFKLEFEKSEEKIRVLEGGLWRHKGDALIVVHYDGCTRPSEVRISNIALWIRFYDLPQTMMKETFAQLLGGQVGRFIKMDARYPGYLRVRVDFPLRKALVPQLNVKIKGRGLMHITVRYENVPHFCFTCGRLGHAAMNCVEGEAEDSGIKFGEELSASPPRRTRDLTIRQVTRVWPGPCSSKPCRGTALKDLRKKYRKDGHQSELQL